MEVLGIGNAIIDVICKVDENKNAVIEKTKALLLEYPHTIVLWNALRAS